MKHYRIDLSGKRLVEVAGMEKPEYAIDHFTYNSRSDYDNRVNWAAYNEHLRSLTSYPLASIPEGWKDGDVVTEGEFDICHQQWLPKTLSSHGEWINVCKDDANRFKRDTRIIAVPIAKDVKEGGSNFVYTQPDSHFWTSIEMMLNFYNHYKNGDVNANYIIIGLQNTLKNGYDIQSLPSPSGKEDEPAGNKIFRIYKQMPDNPLKKLLANWFSQYDPDSDSGGKEDEVKAIAQWVIDNRYPKSENNKVSDLELFHTICDKINALYNHK